MIYLNLFWGFLQVGAFSFGGGYGAIPLIREVVLRYGWLTDDMLAEMIAVSESTPGPIMINLATYVGSAQAGFAGAAAATLAVILPSFIVVLLIMAALRAAIKSPYAEAVMTGLKACVAGVILATGCFMIAENCFFSTGAFTADYRPPLLTAVLAAVYFGSRLIRKKGLSPIVLIGVAAALGAAVFGYL